MLQRRRAEFESDYDSDAAGPSAPRRRRGPQPPARGAAAPSALPAAAAAGPSGAAAAPPSAAAADAELSGFFMIKRTGAQRYATCAALEAALLQGDKVILHGSVQGPLTVRHESVVLVGVPASMPMLLAVEQLLATECPLPRHTLVVDAHKVSVRNMRIWTSRAVDFLRPLAAAVQVEEGVQHFRMSGCEITGHRADILFDEKRVSHGHSGIILCRGVRAFLEQVRVMGLSGAGIVARYNAVAHFGRIDIAAVGGNGLWLDGAGPCTLDAVSTYDCSAYGIYVDAMDLCTLVNCSARKSGNSGLVIDVPNTLLERYKGALAPVLLTAPHVAIGFRSSDNGTYGVQVKAAAAVDLRGSRIERNDLNAVRVEYAVPLAGAVARILLADAQLLQNGRGGDVYLLQREDAAVGVERFSIGGASLRDMVDDTGVIMQGNGADALVEVDP